MCVWGGGGGGGLIKITCKIASPTCRADRGVAESIGKLDSFVSKPVNVRSFDFRVAISM